jgi:hypothetical protein
VLIIADQNAKLAARWLSDQHVFDQFEWLHRHLPTIKLRERSTSPRTNWIIKNSYWCDWYLYYLKEEAIKRNPQFGKLLPVIPRPPGKGSPRVHSFYTGDAKDHKRDYSHLPGIAANRSYLNDLYTTEPATHTFKRRHRGYFITPKTKVTPGIRKIIREKREVGLFVSRARSSRR